MSETSPYTPYLPEQYGTLKNAANFDDTDREKAVRRERVSEIIDGSIGTVGVYTSMNMSHQERHERESAIEGRGVSRSVDVYGSGGWQNYGEVPLDQKGTFGAVAHKTKNGESLDVLEKPDGSSEVLYSFGSKLMTDDTGRPGNALNVGFSLDAAGTRRFRDMIAKDPSVIHDITAAQLKGLGFSASRIDKLTPVYGTDFFDASLEPPAGAELSVTMYAPGTRPGEFTVTASDALPFDNPVPFNETGQIENDDPISSTHPEAVPGEIMDGPGAAARQVATYVEAMRDSDMDSAEICDELIDNAYDAYEAWAQGDADAIENMQASADAYKDEILTILSSGESIEAGGYELLDQAIVAYGDVARRAGVDPKSLPSADSYIGDNKELERASFKVTALKDALSEMMTIDDEYIALATRRA